MNGDNCKMPSACAGKPRGSIADIQCLQGSANAVAAESDSGTSDLCVAQEHGCIAVCTQQSIVFSIKVGVDSLATDPKVPYCIVVKDSPQPQKSNYNVQLKGASAGLSHASL